MKELTGVVLGTKMKRVAMVRVERIAQHPKYLKYVTKRTKVAARDDIGCQPGDRVRIISTRPLSAKTRWRVMEIIIRHSTLGVPEPDLTAVEEILAKNPSQPKAETADKPSAESKAEKGE